MHRPKHLFHAESFGGVGLVKDRSHDVGGTNRIVPLEITASSTVMLQFVGPTLSGTS